MSKKIRAKDTCVEKKTFDVRKTLREFKTRLFVLACGR